MFRLIEPMSSDVPKTLTQREESRQRIIDYENLLKQQEGVQLGDNELTPIKHFFGEGTYVRQMFVPAGVTFTGHIHNFDHIIIIAQGKIQVFNENLSEYETLTGPCILEQKKGIKRIGFALTDVYWYNIHCNPSNTKNIEKINNRLVSETYQGFQKAIKPSFIKKIKSLWHSLQQH